jgi:RNA polymerase sigma factor (sigma-70 family)
MTDIDYCSCLGESELEQKVHEVTTGRAPIDVILEDKQFQTEGLRICCRYDYCYKQYGLEAADIYQDAVLRVWTNRQKIEGNAENIPDKNSFLAWFATVVHNICRDVRRKQQMYLVDEKASEDLEVFASALDPYSDCFIREFKEYVGNLPPEQRRAVEARLSGQSYREIAKAEGCSHVTIRNHVAKALRPYFNLDELHRTRRKVS